MRGGNRKLSAQYHETDHDILIEIRADLKNFNKTFDSHVRTDCQQFSYLGKKVDYLQRIFWIFSGGLAVLIFIIRMIK